MKSNTSKILAISFGSDRRYLKIAKNTIDEFLNIYPSAKSKIYGPDDLAPDLFSYAKKYPRGFGYFQWKPFVLLDAINSLMDGDILIYIDARCGIPACRVSWIDDLCGHGTSIDQSLDFAAWQLDIAEQSRTTSDLMDVFGVTLNSPHAISGHFSATFFGLQVNQVTRNMVGQWHAVMKENRHLTRDEPSILQNHETFTENRYDQSVLSLVIKKYEREGCIVLRIPELLITGGEKLGQHNCSNDVAKSIYPWGKPHPGTFFSRSIYPRIYKLKLFIPKRFHPYAKYIGTIWRNFFR